MATIGEVYGPAMEIQTPEEAAAFLEKETQRHVEEFGQDREEARRVILSNVGYYAGYYDSETQKRVYRLFNTEHPVFGKMGA